ncbi:putative tartrate transporter [compost metagenome]
MFVVEGIPAVILGIVVWFCLAEKPEDAKWLSAEERSLLARMLERDRAASMSTAQAAGTKKNWLQVFSPVILLFTLTYFFLTNTLSTVAVWGPQILKGIYQERDSLTIGMLNAIPQVVTIVAMILWGRSSDRMGERKVHAILAFLCAAAGWLIAAQGGHPALQLLGVCMASAGAFSGMALFWAVPHQSLDPRLLAVGIGFINAFGNIGGALNPVLMGYMRDASGDFRTGLYVVATFLVLGACLIAVLPFNKVRTPGTERASA